MRPSLGLSSPSSMLSKVVLPMPLGPNRPMRSPAMILQLKLSTMVAFSKRCDTSMASINSFPGLTPDATRKLMSPPRSLRAARCFLKSSRARTLPSLRVLRAGIPLRIHFSSLASILSNLLCSLASIASNSVFFFKYSA